MLRQNGASSFTGEYLVLLQYFPRTCYFCQDTSALNKVGQQQQQQQTNVAGAARLTRLLVWGGLRWFEGAAAQTAIFSSPCSYGSH